MGTAQERFWARVARADGRGCWLWTGAVTSCGYGRVGNGPEAHRQSWEIHNGPIPVGMRVCHSCDNPPCVNPSHLFLGTAADNSADMVSKGRSNRGERNGNARLTTSDVVSIRRLRQEGVTLRSVATRFGISRQTVLDITARRRWAHV